MKSLILSLSLIAVSMQAAEDPRLRNLDNRVSALEQRKNGGGVILPSAGANLDDDVGICLDGELLIWKAHQTGMNFAQGVVGANETTSTNPYVKPNFRFDPGLRLQFGLRPSHDDWELDAVWTHFYTKAKQNYENSQIPVLPLFGLHQPSGTTANDVSTSVSAVWRVNLNIIDLELARASFLSKWVSVKPYIALRNLWLNQKYNVTAALPTTPQIGSSQIRSNLWAMGPRAGFELKFGLGEGFYFFNNTSASLLWGFFKNSQTTVQQTGNLSTSYPRGPVDVHTSTYNVDMSVGLGWDRKFDDNHYRISIRGAWEHHLFADTNFFQSSAFLNTFTANDTPNGNFTTEGFTLSLRFDF